MKWDSTLAAQAQNWANNCNFEHSPSSSRPGAGENLAIRGTSGLVDENGAGRDAVERWADESNDVIGTEGLFPFTSVSNSRGDDIGHWTAMIWDDTDTVSCFPQSNHLVRG